MRTLSATVAALARPNGAGPAQPDYSAAALGLPVFAMAEAAGVIALGSAHKCATVNGLLSAAALARLQRGSALRWCCCPVECSLGWIRVASRVPIIASALVGMTCAKEPSRIALCCFVAPARFTTLNVSLSASACALVFSGSTTSTRRQNCSEQLKANKQTNKQTERIRSLIVSGNGKGSCLAASARSGMQRL